MKLSELLDIELLESEIEAGNVTRRFHPDYQLAILNYTDHVQFKGRWNEITRQTRGLIYNWKTGEIVARPFGKFFNYGDEPNTGHLSLDTPVWGYYDKADGSLGILYPTPDGTIAVATRGSFVSDQALHATALLQTEEYEWMREDAHEWRGIYTSLVEIIYPENRIVLNYGDDDKLVLLGFVYMKTGRFEPEGGWLFGQGETVFEGKKWEEPHLTLRDVVSLPDRPNAEGYVIWLNPTTAIKLKQEDYKALHRIVSNLTPKEVWRQGMAGTLEAFMGSVPDEFFEEVKWMAHKLGSEFNDIFALATLHMSHLRQVQDESAEGWTRREQAEWIQAMVPKQYQGLVFSLLDNKSIDQAIYRMIEPKGNA